MRYFETRYTFKDQNQGIRYKRDVGYGQGDEKLREYFEKGQGKGRKGRRGRSYEHNINPLNTELNPICQ